MYTAIWPSNCTLGIHPEKGNHMSKALCTHVHCSYIPNNDKLETTVIPVSGKMNCTNRGIDIGQHTTEWVNEESCWCTRWSRWGSFKIYSQILFHSLCWTFLWIQSDIVVHLQATQSTWKWCYMTFVTGSGKGIQLLPGLVALALHPCPTRY